MTHEDQAKICQQRKRKVFANRGTHVCRGMELRPCHFRTDVHIAEGTERKGNPSRDQVMEVLQVEPGMLTELFQFSCY